MRAPELVAELLDNWKIAVRLVNSDMRQLSYDDLIGWYVSRDMLSNQRLSSSDWTVLGALDEGFFAATVDDTNDLLSQVFRKGDGEQGWWWGRVPGGGEIRKTLLARVRTEQQ